MTTQATMPTGAILDEPEGDVLSLRSVSKTFGAVAALTDVDMDVNANEVVAIVGDNGAGKSTLIKILSGVFPPTSGTIHFEGKPVTIDSPATAHHLGIATVFQDLALCENLNVIQNLFLGQELGTLRLNEVDMEVRSWDLLRQDPDGAHPDRLAVRRAAADRSHRTFPAWGSEDRPPRRADGRPGRRPDG
jgi:ABC-type sugar transport system ATPase subunit